MNNLTPRERRLIACAILVLLIAATWLLVVSPILQGFSMRQAQREQAQAELAEDARLVAGFSRVKADLVVLRREAQAYAIFAHSPAAAADAARNRVSKAVAAEGGTLQALRSQAAAPRRVRLQADMRLSLPQLAQLVRRLETERPFATIDSLTIAAGDENGSGVPAGVMDVRLGVTYAVY